MEKHKYIKITPAGRYIYPESIKESKRDYSKIAQELALQEAIDKYGQNAYASYPTIIEKNRNGNRVYSVGIGDTEIGLDSNRTVRYTLTRLRELTNEQEEMARKEGKEVLDKLLKRNRIN